MTVVKVTPPSQYPVTVAQAKTHCRVDITDDDTLFSDLLIPAATEYAELFLRRPLVTQTLKMTFKKLHKEIQFSIGNIRSVDSITYLDGDGARQTLAADQYTYDVDSEPVCIVPAYNVTYPTVREIVGSVVVTFTAGYAELGSPSDQVGDIPTAIKQAILLHIGELYENREQTVIGATVAKLDAYSALLWAHRFL